MAQVQNPDDMPAGQWQNLVDKMEQIVVDHKKSTEATSDLHQREVYRCPLCDEVFSYEEGEYETGEVFLVNFEDIGNGDGEIYVRLDNPPRLTTTSVWWCATDCLVARHGSEPTPYTLYECPSCIAEYELPTTARECCN